MMLARVAEHNGAAAYASVNFIPWPAKLSMFGVS